MQTCRVAFISIFVLMGYVGSAGAQTSGGRGSCPPFEARAGPAPGVSRSGPHVRRPIQCRLRRRRARNGARAAADCTSSPTRPTVSFGKSYRDDRRERRFEAGGLTAH
jgi:hypothetical protein